MSKGWQVNTSQSRSHYKPAILSNMHTMQMNIFGVQQHQSQYKVTFLVLPIFLKYFAQLIA